MSERKKAGKSKRPQRSKVKGTTSKKPIVQRGDFKPINKLRAKCTGLLFAVKGRQGSGKSAFAASSARFNLKNPDLAEGGKFEKAGDLIRYGIFPPIEKLLIISSDFEWPRMLYGKYFQPYLEFIGVENIELYEVYEEKEISERGDTVPKRDPFLTWQRWDEAVHALRNDENAMIVLDSFGDYKEVIDKVLRDKVMKLPRFSTEGVQPSDYSWRNVQYIDMVDKLNQSPCHKIVTVQEYPKYTSAALKWDGKSFQAKWSDRILPFKSDVIVTLKATWKDKMIRFATVDSKNRFETLKRIKVQPASFCGLMNKIAGAVYFGEGK